MKVLFSSDWHIRDHHRFNREPRERLNSFPTLAREVVKIGQDNNVDTLILGGDLIDKPNLRAYEIHVVFEVVSILKSHFKNIYSIVGNHDMNLKKGEFSEDDTLVTLLDEIEFLHRQVIDLGGRKIGFQNWEPEINLDWIKEPLDILVSHMAVDYDNTGLYGIDIDPYIGKAKKFLFGDIHVAREMGDFISIGNPKQETLNDKDQGSVLLMDLDDLSFERIPIDPNRDKFLHLIKTEDPEEEGWVGKKGLKYKLYRPKRSKKNNTVDFKLPDIGDIEGTLISIMKEKNLMELHEKIKLGTSYVPTDFNFTIDSLEVFNYRSIKYHKLNIGDSDFIVTGANGSGKSTLITGLYYGLIGKKTLRQDIHFGESECRLITNLTYQDTKYIITRGTSSGDYGLNVGGVELKYNNKNEFEKDVFEHLPFLLYIDSFFFNYWDTELLGSMRVDRRYDLMSKFYRLDALSGYNDVATLESKTKKREIKSKEAELETQKVLTDSKFLEYKSLLEKLEGKLSKEELEKEIEIYNKFTLLTSKITEGETLISDTKHSIAVTEAETRSAKASVDATIVNPVEIFSEEDKKLKLELSKEIEEIRSKWDTKKSEIDKLYNEVGKDWGISNSKVENLETRLKDYKTKESKTIKDLEVKISKFDPEDDRLVKNYRKEISDLEAKILEIETHGGDEVCDSCGQEVDHEKKIKSLEASKLEVEKEVAETVKELLEVELKKLTSDLDVLKESFEKETQNLSDEIEKEKETLKNLTEKGIEAKKEKDRVYAEASEIGEQEISLVSGKLQELVVKEANIEAHNKLVKQQEEKLAEAKVLLETKKLEKEELEKELKVYEDLVKGYKKEISSVREITSEQNIENHLLVKLHTDLERESEAYKKLTEKKLRLENDLKEDQLEFFNLELYCEMTSRSGPILKKILEVLTEKFSEGPFRFTTDTSQASGKLVTDLSVEFLVGKRWVPYKALSSGQKTLCDLYFIQKVITGVGILVLDETLRFLDDESIKLASEMIGNTRRKNLIISTHNPNLNIDASTLYCSLNGSVTDIKYSY